jgi:valyl-tRNA synthetase
VNCENPEPIVAAQAPDKCPTCGGALRQDEDVLDTWFSSGLWPFSTLGWPDETPDLKTYYPTSLLITGFDIIFFWVARMMMMGLRFMDDVPFRDVYITPLVRDQFGKKMTKSRGNVVDPLDIIERYGTDAVRFTLAQLAVQGRDLILSDDRLAASRAFANKIWNAARFAMLNLEGAPAPVPPPDLGKLRLAERWILDRLDSAIRDVTRAIDEYEFNLAALRIYQFIWHEFCDWYIELAKEPLKAGGEAQAAARWVLVRCLDGLLRLLHPFMPFISEEIWQELRKYIDDPNLTAHLAIARFPEPAEKRLLSEAEGIAMAHCIEVTDAVNSLRALVGVHPGAKVHVWIRPVLNPKGTVEDSRAKANERVKQDLEIWAPYLETMAKAERPQLLKIGEPFPERSVGSFLPWCELAVEPPKDFDIEKTRAALEKKLDQVRGYLKQHEKRLEDAVFLKKASQETISETHDRRTDLQSEESLLERQLQSLGVQVES